MAGGSEPILSLKFDKPGLVGIESYNELQQAVMPVAGITDAELTPFATCFGISRSLPIVVTAWHVVSEFIKSHQSQLESGAFQLAVLYETGKPIAGTSAELGGPLPVFQVAYQDDSDIAVMALFDVDSRGRRIAPASVEAITFRAPQPQNWCYGFGYPNFDEERPTLAGGEIQVENGRRFVDLRSTFYATGGRVIDAFPEGHEGHWMVKGPSILCDAPGPHGMSGCPIATDERGICGVMSTAIDPFEDEPWSTFVTLMAPILEYRFSLRDETGLVSEQTVRDLVEQGHIEVAGDVPSPPAIAPKTKTLTFGFDGGIAESGT